MCAALAGRAPLLGAHAGRGADLHKAKLKAPARLAFLGRVISFFALDAGWIDSFLWHVVTLARAMHSAIASAHCQCNEVGWLRNYVTARLKKEMIREGRGTGSGSYWGMA